MLRYCPKIAAISSEITVEVNPYVVIVIVIVNNLYSATSKLSPSEASYINSKLVFLDLALERVRNCNHRSSPKTAAYY